MPLSSLTSSTSRTSPSQLSSRWRPNSRAHRAHQAPEPLGDAALGMMVTKWSSKNYPVTTYDWLLYTAHRTWMNDIQAVGLEMLMLVDCNQTYLQTNDNAAFRHSPQDETTPIGKLPVWLSARDAGRAAAGVKLHARCFWRDVPLGANFGKLATLLRCLYLWIAPKRWYLKVDMDALLMPVNFLRIIQSLEAMLPDEAPVYFGSDVFRLHRPGLSSVGSTQPANRFQLGSACRAQQASSDSRPKSCFVTSSAWLALEAAQNWTASEASAAHATPMITYAQGGAEGLSRAALLLAISDDCVNVVGNAVVLHNDRFKSSLEMSSGEDLVLGLCMHLKQVRLLECPAFHGDPPCDLPGIYHSKGMHACADNSSSAKLARYPITVHKLKSNVTMLSWWEALSERERMGPGDDLRAWRISSRPSER